jgi:hypothetical protein
MRTAGTLLPIHLVVAKIVIGGPKMLLKMVRATIKTATRANASRILLPADLRSQAVM